MWFRKKEKLTVKESLQKMGDDLENAWEKYDKNPSFRNYYYLNGLMNILERFVSNVETLGSKK